MTPRQPPPPMHPLLERVAMECDGLDKAVIVTDAGGVILRWSRGAEELYGWPADEVLGRHILGVTPTSLSMGEGARIMSLLQAGIPWLGAFATRTRSGEQIMAEVLDIPVRGEGGAMHGIVGISRRTGG